MRACSTLRQQCGGSAVGGPFVPRCCDAACVVKNEFFSQCEGTLSGDASRNGTCDDVLRSDECATRPGEVSARRSGEAISKAPQNYDDRAIVYKTHFAGLLQGDLGRSTDSGLGVDPVVLISTAPNTHIRLG